MNNKIWLSSPHMGGTEQGYVQEAFDTNWIAPLGPNVNGFEDAIQDYLGQGKEVAAISSGTAGIHLALILLGIQRDDLVLCQSFTFSASANPIMYQGATPIFIDSEKETWNMCPEHLEEAIKDCISNHKKPKAIIAVHLYGMPYKATAIAAVAQKYNIPVIEDSAEALGSTYKNQKCGTFGDISILSFNGNKIITTSGGGALVCSSETMKQKAVFLATQARDQAPHYEHSHIGYNYRMSNICAGIGRGQMEVLDKHVALRREMHFFYKEIFKDVAGVSVFEEPTSEYYSNHWLSAIDIDPSQTGGVSSKDLMDAFAKANIESRPLWKPMHLQPVFKNEKYYGNGVAEDLFKNGLCLPSGSNLNHDDKDRIEKAIFTLFKA